MALEDSLLHDQSVPLSSIQTNPITAADVSRSHQLFMNNGKSLKVSKLLEILGGADAILQHYLSSDNLSPLTVDQSTDINELVVFNSNHDDDGCHPIPILPALASDTFLHQMLGDSTANKIVNIIHSKPMVIAISFGIVINLILAYLLFYRVLSGISYILTDIVDCIIIMGLILYISTSTLSANKVILSGIMRTFIFWFKLFFAIKYRTCVIIYQWKIFGSIYGGAILGAILPMIVIAWYALFDAIQLPLRVKIGVGVLGSIYFLWASWGWTFLDEPCYITINWWGDYTSVLDMREWTASAARVVTIFICKQTIYSIWKPSESALLERSVQIAWNINQFVDQKRLIEILGGVDAILQHYLSSDNLSPLTVQQLTDISKLITEESNNIDGNEPDDAIWILRVSPQNTFLHGIFGNKIGDKIVDFMYSKLMSVTVVLVIIIEWSLSGLDNDGRYPMWINILHYVFYSCVIVYGLLSLLNVNKKILKHILHTFIFWVEISFGIKYSICGLIYRWKKAQMYPGEILWCMVTMIAILVYALMDGLNMPIKTKIGYGIVCASYFIWISFYWTFIVTEPCFMEPKWWHSHSSEFDMGGWTASALRLVTIFMCKQMIYCIWKPSYATLIKRSVQIVWV